MHRMRTTSCQARLIALASFANHVLDYPMYEHFIECYIACFSSLRPPDMCLISFSLAVVFLSCSADSISLSLSFLLPFIRYNRKGIDTTHIFIFNNKNSTSSMNTSELEETRNEEHCSCSVDEPPVLTSSANSDWDEEISSLNDQLNEEELEQSSLNSKGTLHTNASKSKAIMTSNSSRRKTKQSKLLYCSLFLILFILNNDALYERALYTLHVAVYLYGAVLRMANIDKVKSPPTKYSRSLHREAPWPNPPLVDRFNSTKILWGYWHAGQENLTGVAQVALRSWVSHHPGWQVIIVSDDNFREYVPHSHIPSTFESLKVQHRSDIVRLSVLMNYGGAYLDVTTVMFKSLNGIWDQALNEESDKIFVTSVLEFGSEEDRKDSDDSSPKQVALLNNAIILSPRPNNPILAEFLRRCILYSENPATSIEEFKSRPEFSRVIHHLNDTNLGLLGGEGLLLYSANLWIFTDLVLYDESLRAGEYVIDLPALRWSFDFLVLPDVFDTARRKKALELDCGNCSRVSSWLRRYLALPPIFQTQRQLPIPQELPSTVQEVQQLRITNWKLWNVILGASRMTRFTRYDDQDVAASLVDGAVMIKMSADHKQRVECSYEDWTGMKSTIGRIYRAAAKGTGRNASLEDARPIGFGAPSVW